MTDEPKRAAASVRNWVRKRDFYAGTLITLIGLVAAVTGPTYRLGTLVQMGPGFMPTALGIVLILLGIIMAVSAMAVAAGEDEDILPEFPQWRGWLCVLAGPVVFIILGTVGGLIPATFGCVFVSAWGDHGATLKSAGVLALVIAAFGVAVFSYLLQVPMPLLTWNP
ncbi:MAG TPA: tripartite tricarboxylate transporter TctB family protein [Stellaceae bacterium]|nr:tripartite tricarboxylate transporter TctB family protein [Stellaceae bacterium]